MDAVMEAALREQEMRVERLTNVYRLIVYLARVPRHLGRDLLAGDL